MLSTLVDEDLEKCTSYKDCILTLTLNQMKILMGEIFKGVQSSVRGSPRSLVLRNIKHHRSVNSKNSICQYVIGLVVHLLTRILKNKKDS